MLQTVEKDLSPFKRSRFQAKRVVSSIKISTTKGNLVIKKERCLQQKYWLHRSPLLHIDENQGQSYHRYFLKRKIKIFFVREKKIHIKTLFLIITCKISKAFWFFPMFIVVDGYGLFFIYLCLYCWHRQRLDR